MKWKASIGWEVLGAKNNSDLPSVDERILARERSIASKSQYVCEKKIFPHLGHRIRIFYIDCIVLLLFLLFFCCATAECFCLPWFIAFECFVKARIWRVSASKDPLLLLKEDKKTYSNCAHSSQNYCKPSREIEKVLQIYSVHSIYAWDKCQRKKNCRKNRQCFHGITHLKRHICDV